MNFRKPNAYRNREVEITVIPLIDLFMVILVFFMLTTTFNQDSVFFVDLPETNGSGLGKDMKLLQISIGSDGEIAINNQKITLEGIKSYLDQLGQNGKKDMPVSIRADQNVTHGKVVDVIDIVQAAGFTNMGILTRQRN